MRIKAAVLNAMGVPGPYAETKPLSIEELELEGPGHGEVLVRVAAAGLCHSDLSVINGDRARPMPMALGHEAAGVVQELGPGVDDLQKGDHVVMVFVPSCGHCLPCAEGRPALCEPGAVANVAGTLLSGARRLSRNGAPVNHHLGVSAFAEYVTVSRRSIVKIDPELPLDEAALFGCAVLTGVGAVLNTARMTAGESVAVYGLGGVGLAAVMGALAGGAAKVVVIDPIPAKRALALEVGALAAFDPSDDESAIVDALGGARPDLVIETAGKAAVLAIAYRLARRGGRIVTVGLPNPAEQLSIPAVSLVADGKTLIGSYMGSSIPSRDIPRYIALWRAGRLPVEKLLTSVSPLSDINELFDTLASGQAIRQVVKP